MIGVKTVLLVENDLVALTMYRDRLQREGFHVETAEDGQVALSHLAKMQIDLVVLDLMLPVLNGTEVFKKIRSDERLKDMPVVIFSNATMPDWPQDLSSGPTRSLLKSETTFSILLQNIRDCLAASPARSTSPFPDDRGQSDTATFFAYYNTAPTSAVPCSSGGSEFLRTARTDVPKIREDCYGYIKAPSSPASQRHLSALRDRMQALGGRAKTAGCDRMVLLANSFHALLADLIAKPSKVTPSMLQTIAQAVDCLGFMLDGEDGDLFESMLTPHAMVVDDDPVSNQVNVTALEQASFETTSIQDPLTALELLESTPFDLIVLDVNMPQLTGFEVCERLRRLPQGKTTPVIFLTAFNNFENRKQSVLSGGGDFISKPVSTRELALKATIHLIKSQLQITRTSRLNANPTLEDSTASPSEQARRPAPTAFAAETESATSDPESESASPAIAPLPETSDVFQFVESAKTIPQGATAQFLSVSSSVPLSSGVVKGPGFAPASNSAPVFSRSIPTQENASSLPSSPGAVTADAEEGDRSVLVRRLHTAESALEHLRAEVETTRLAAREAKKSGEEVAARSEQLQKEIVDLQGKLEASEAALAKSQREHAEIQEQLRQDCAEAKATASQLAEARQAIESDLRDQINAACVAAEKANTTRAAAEVRCLELEKESGDLRIAVEILTREKQEVSAEVELLRSERPLRANELADAQRKAAEAEAARTETEAQTRQLRDELAALKQATGQLEHQQQQTTTERDALKSELALLVSERARSESELREKLESVRLAGSASEALAKEKGEWGRLLEEEADNFRKINEGLLLQNQQLSTELDHFKSELPQQQERLSNALRTAEQAEASRGEIQVQYQKLEDESRVLRQSNDELRKQQQQSASECERLKSELENLVSERSRGDSEFRGQLEAVTLACSQAQALLKEKEDWGRLVEEESANFRKANELLRNQQEKLESELAQLKSNLPELQDKLAAALRAVEQSEGLLKQQESRLSDWGQQLSDLRIENETLRREQQSGAVEMERATAELVQRSAQQARLEADRQSATELNGSLQTELRAYQERYAALESKFAESANAARDNAEALARITVELASEHQKREHFEKRTTSLTERLQNLHLELGKCLNCDSD